MKKILSMCLALVMVLSLCAIPASAIGDNLDESGAKVVAENYLRAKMNDIYLRVSPASADEVKTLLDYASLLDDISQEKSENNLADANIPDWNEQGDDMAAALTDEASAEASTPGDESNDAAIPEHESSFDDSVSEEAPLAEPALTMEKLDSMVTFAERNAMPVAELVERNGVSVDAMLGDLRCMEDMTTYYAHIYEDQNVSFSDFDANYFFDDVVVDGDFAMVEVFEELNYQYSDCDEPSYELGEFNVMLVKLDGEWVVADVVSDDSAFLSSCTTSYDADSEIRAYDEAKSFSYESTATVPAEDEDADIALAAASNIPYNRQNAVNYALTYTTQADDSHRTPTFRNTRFNWFGKDCMNFASQCVWAGFGGSNSWADIPAHQGMDTVNPYWWCDNAEQCPSGSWASCGAFRTYIKESKNLSSMGLICKNSTVPETSNDLGYSASQLVGAVLHVDTSFGHALFVNAATGTIRDKVMVCSYNNCRKNVKLSLLYPAKNDPASAVEVIIPQTFQGGQTGLRVYGDLLNTIVTHTATRSLVGHSDVTCSSLEMVLLNPNGGQAGRWTASNTNVISASYNNWNITGEWSLKITGKTSAGASMTWYGTIRVV